MKVSGYIITKNNGRSLKWALESVYKYLDEIIIVDSGSTDNTVEIAKQYTDKIYFNEFKDFSDQRNFAIKKCTGDWIFTMDADEVMGENFFNIFKYLKNSKYKAFLLPRYNLVDINPCVFINGPDHYSEWQVRFFKNDGICYYENPVHHQLKNCKPRLKIPYINIFHFHWLMYDRKKREERVKFYESIDNDSGFERLYIFEKYKHTYLKTIEKIEPSLMNELIKDKFVHYRYNISHFEQTRHIINIKIKKMLTNIRFNIGI